MRGYVSGDGSVKRFSVQQGRRLVMSSRIWTEVRQSQAGVQKTRRRGCWDASGRQILYRVKSANAGNTKGRRSAGSTTGTATTGGTTGGTGGGVRGAQRGVGEGARRLCGRPGGRWTTFADQHWTSPENNHNRRVKRKRLRTKTTTVVVSSWRIGMDCRRSGPVCQTGKSGRCAGGRWQGESVGVSCVNRSSAPPLQRYPFAFAGQMTPDTGHSTLQHSPTHPVYPMRRATKMRW